MARMSSATGRVFALALLALAATLSLRLAVPAFVPMPRETGTAMAGVAAGMAALPVWAYSAGEESQLLLARVPGGKFEKMKDLTVPAPEQDGFTDSQIAFLIVIAGVLFVLAADFARNLNEGQNPTKFKEGKTGYMTPLIKRVIEQGF
eukprot:CAMPEP_0170630522 /NCGR_PEP_ID=MMETSP0224-20130122/34053_1 /TAXON_ID=285029 /ORGANISM="Togula jolla, Strain CCCM 725" /LENGTH=147 /DNA_ID=CAMNT_0010958601 /DNA_START=58 /DNA_END=501 /DNA_ORIENTATION=+